MDISIDCETLSVNSGPAIISIGAVWFEPSTGKTGKEFYAEINIDDAIRNGHVSGSTIAWWVGQGPNARQLFDRSREKVPLAAALDGLAALMRSTDAGCVWTKGPAEDAAWLANAFQRVGLEVPWPHHRSRCVRTIIELAELNGTEVKDVGIHHNALDDAKFQAQVVSFGYQKIQAAISGKPAPKPKKAAPPPVDDEDDEL